MLKIWIKSFNSRFTLATAPILLASVVFLGSGCTSIPQRELTAYRQAFSETRIQSENVLADYAAARQMKTNRFSAAMQKRAGAISAAPLSANLGLAQLNARSGETVETDITIRLRAWDILDRYNEALLALASGAKPAEVQVAVNGLLEAIQNFPIKEVSKMAADAAPYAAIAADLFEMIQKEVEARRFRNAVLKAAPFVHSFVDILFKDAELFHRYRMALLDEEFDEKQNEMNGLVDRFRDLVSSHNWEQPREVNAVIKEVNGNAIVAAGVQTFAPVNETAGAGPFPSADQQRSELLDLKSIATALQFEADKARDVALSQKNYHEMMLQYAAVLRAFEAKITEFAVAAEKSRGRLPNAVALERVVSDARVAYTIYSQSR